ncbi:steroid delta-isomerase [Ruegeria sediminis]|uniref:Steroid delta-isomerase n=1 Tax=Ruegeria sediminis TaxID=2583820 RepID=A0ABY2WSH7_9RHOB|nr:nuclear transport factor 2 family protein [Ruegeria sediminis]TMV03357.1 steroid delta-isomerase [Ruegeria sediminis]
MKKTPRHGADRLETIENRLGAAAVSDATVAHRTGVVRSYIAALNAANLDAVAAVFSDDAVLLDPLGADPVAGLPAIRAFFANGPFLHPIDAALDGEVRVAGNAAAFAFTAHSDGKTMRIIDVFEFDENGKVSRMVAYWSGANVSTGGR